MSIDMEKEKFNKLLIKCRHSGIGADAMNELIEFYFPKIVIHISAKFRSKSLGEDMAQEFFTKLLKIEIKEEIEKPLAWIYRICDNLAKDYIEKDNRYRAAYMNGKIEISDGPFERMVFLEYIEKINQFNPEMKVIVLMFVYDGYTLKEIAEEMDLNYNTVRQKFSRAMKKLKKL